MAALAATAAAPLFSRRAMRRALARARLLLPPSERQALAGADALRAVEQATIAFRAESGRQFAESMRLEREIADLERALYGRRAESEKLAADGRRLQATLGATRIALDDAFAERDGAVAKRSEAEAVRDRARIAVGAARVEYLEGRVEALTEATKAARGETAEIAAASRAADAQLRESIGRIGREAVRLFAAHRPSDWRSARLRIESQPMRATSRPRPPARRPASSTMAGAGARGGRARRSHDCAAAFKIAGEQPAFVKPGME